MTDEFPGLTGEPPPPPPLRVDPRFRRRWAEARRAEGRRRLRALVAGCCALALAGAGFGVLHSPLLEVRHIEVAGNKHTPRAEILRAAGLSKRGVLMIDAGPRRAVNAVEALPWVARVSFARRWPWTLVVRVLERSPSALVQSGDTTDVVDGTGRVLEAVPRGGALPFLPSVLGATLAAPGRTVMPKAPTTQADLGELLLAAKSAPLALGERHLSLSWSGAGGLVAHLAGTAATVLLGDPTRLSYKLGVLAEIATDVKLSGYSLVDLTVPARPALTPLSA
jgi:POTRA domain, FtsQ-type